MKRSFRSLSTFVGGAVLIAFACFAAPNCQPSGGDPNGGVDEGEGGSGEGGKASGGSGGSGNGSGGKAGSGGSESGGSGGSSGNEGTGGKSDGSGGKGSGGKGSGGKGDGGSGGKGEGGSGSGGSSSGSGSGGATGAGGVVGAGGTTTATTPVGGTTGSTGARLCNPKTATTPAITSTGGLTCSGGLCTVGTYSGYLYTYGDGTSTICAGPDSLCASGTTGAGDTAGKIWGAGVGVNLDKTDPPAAVQLSGTGLTYALSALPTQGMRAQVTVGSTDYCVKLAAASGTVLWTAFNTKCWDDSGEKLAAAPKTPHVGFQVTAATAAGTFDFCVKSISF
jgi:hypothetical protein